jgi:hypothetical protein
MAGPGTAGVLTQSGNYTALLLFGAATVIIASLLIATAAARARPGVSVAN